MEQTKSIRGDTLPKKGHLQSDVSSAAAAEGVNHTNPGGTMVSEKGNSEKSGNAPEYGVYFSNFMVRAKTNMEWLTPNDMGDSFKEIMSIPEEVHVVSNLKAEGNVSLHGSTHVEEMGFNGPKPSKSWPTWTRLVRMIYGVEDSSPTKVATMLGKRGLYQEWMDEGSESEVHLRKQKKIQVDPNKMAGALKHPCRSQ